ncbi:hypothetical protein [Cohnella nanjingensis]|uniref:Uncharacterized protein n=1 Tax=Cohnella nanjingensis TaxID=1387779 RepID=A0A7X0RS83_9BACL|nr:hypothetical protein [Cohnella nanjingensis]MBB6672590.1 hypothetical protein [Cohnella nanjingensis]
MDKPNQVTSLDQLNKSAQKNIYKILAKIEVKKRRTSHAITGPLQTRRLQGQDSEHD